VFTLTAAVGVAAGFRQRCHAKPLLGLAQHGEPAIGLRDLVVQFLRHRELRIGDIVVVDILKMFGQLIAQRGAMRLQIFDTL
jgi:hypothetical protein